MRCVLVASTIEVTANLGRSKCRRALQSTASDARWASIVTGELQSSVDLYWLPLGAGGHFVRLNGRIFETIMARIEKRPTKDLYHSALVIKVPEGEFVIEQAPISDRNGALRGVVAEGAVGSRMARSLRIFRYEIRRWRDGVIPDVDEAVDSPQRLTDDPRIAQHVLHWCATCPRQSGDVTSSTQARCGTQTR